MNSIKCPNVSVNTGFQDCVNQSPVVSNTVLNLVELEYVEFDKTESNGCTYQFTSDGKTWMEKSLKNFVKISKEFTRQTSSPVFKFADEYYQIDEGKKIDTKTGEVQHPVPITTGPLSAISFQQFMDEINNLIDPVVTADQLKKAKDFSP